MSRYDCEFFAGYKVFPERHANVPSLLVSLHQPREPLARIIDTKDESYKRLKYLPDEGIYELMHVRHGRVSEEISKALLKSGGSLNHLRVYVHKNLGEWRDMVWVPHDAELQREPKVALWEFYERECRGYVITASRELLVRDDRAMRGLGNMRRAIRRATGKDTRILGPRHCMTVKDIETHRVAAACGPEELAEALMPRHRERR